MSLPVRGASATIIADSVDDICPLIADPCDITDTVEVQVYSVLDFGVRTLRITPSGALRSKGAVVTILAGDILSDPSIPPSKRIVQMVQDADGFVGEIYFTARRACSGDASLPCLTDADCAPTSAGTCSIGTGRIELNGTASGTGAGVGPSYAFTAAGDVLINGKVSSFGVYAASQGSVGGVIEVTSTNGSIVVDGAMQSKGYHSGDDISLTAAVDVTTRQTLRSGKGAAVITVAAGRDATVGSTLDPGYGGEIVVSAGRNALIQSVDTKRLRLDTSSTYLEGRISITAGADLTVDTRVLANLSTRRVGCGRLDLNAGGNLAFGAQALFRCFGGLGDSPTLNSSAGGDLSFGSAMHAYFNSLGSPSVTASAGGNLTHAGRFDIIARGASSTVNMTAAGDMSIAGSISGFYRETSENGSTTLEACSLELLPGSRIGTSASGTGVVNNVLTAHGQMTLASGSTLSTATGGNTLRYRDAGMPPLVSGSASPAAVLVQDPLLSACP